MQSKADDQVYAGFFVRLAAYFIDLLIVGAALLIVRIPFGISSWVAPNNLMVRDMVFKYSIADILIYLLGITYFVVLTYKSGATIGKRLLHLKVISTEDRKITLFEVIYRETIGRFLAGIIVNIGYFMVATHEQKRGMHDLLSDTQVVYYHCKTVVVNTPVDYQEVPPIYVPTYYVQPEVVEETARDEVENIESENLI